MNKLEVMAFRSASIQASWLGYPHSAGLEAIDYLICDPHNVPPRPELLVEKPMLMPKSWIALGQRFFTDAVPIEDGLPEDRHGGLTYGTANNPHKYTREVLRTWARVVKATPGSRFAFIRPEGGSPSFRANIERQFAHEGVGAERIFWYVVRGAHLPYYNQVDITLDTFPLTGGTTTTEALWMGVPVVSLQGEAFYERLSASILTNSGVADHVATDLDGYVAIALDLAADRARRLDLRRTLRERMRQGPLGQTEQFARDFYDMIRRTVRG
jgi:predicted O-linked N-acetylglucosamine transferase (SPINDLY family)